MSGAKSEAEQLAKLRDQIDQLDNQIQQLINARAQCAQQVAEVKNQSGGEQPPVFYRPEREAQVLRAVMDRNEGPIPDEEMARVFREIMSSCLALEQRSSVAYLGPEGTYTESAAIKHFGHAADYQPQAAIDEVFREVEAGTVTYGVVPVENSTEGAVNTTLDSFLATPLHICGEVALRIHHHLMAAPNTDAKNIACIYSHAQTLAQCRKWLDSHYPGVERVAVASNAEAARRVGKEWHSAAIAGETAAERYELKVLAENIEDQPDNTTRFLIVGNHPVPPSGKDKTSIIVSVHDKPGALYDLLAPFEEAGISLTRVETRPSPHSTWSYVFFMDFLGHQDDDKVKQVLAVIRQECQDLKILGSYPEAVL